MTDAELIFAMYYFGTGIIVAIGFIIMIYRRAYHDHFTANRFSNVSKAIQYHIDDGWGWVLLSVVLPWFTILGFFGFKLYSFVVDSYVGFVPWTGKLLEKIHKKKNAEKYV